MLCGPQSRISETSFLTFQPVDVGQIGCSLRISPYVGDGRTPSSLTSHLDQGPCHRRCRLQAMVSKSESIRPTIVVRISAFSILCSSSIVFRKAANLVEVQGGQRHLVGS